ncbi:MAG: hypothetical protein JNL66_16775 [Alphaproteobacteria bacterium]|nr:hypothetical protein [Alphaproteobacteria bacterium]
MAPARAVLVTGFEPFGGFGLNPSALIAERLDGAAIGGQRVIGRTLPVSLADLDGALERVLADVDPVLVLALGLASDEPVIRLERFAVNLADFAIPDNAGARVAGQKLDPDGPAALAARLPLAAIRDALLARGIPSRLSNTAGTYLCNAAMYRLLVRLPETVPCGFIHLPHLPAEAARLMTGNERETVPSMTLDLQVDAVRVALAESLAASPRGGLATS